ncbi:hypothetical protein [Agrobacterium vitis]|uniref:hypothetical protein n=1 Tax=Agrobacterium vitis TaxID=373 RepID=UPI0018D221A8|nr:hypothetical protein [Agrobacterium vitis]
MKIISIRPDPGGGNTLARFDVQLDGMRLHNVALKKTASGYRVFAPSAFGAATVTFTPEIATALVEAAIGEMPLGQNTTAHHAAA